MWKTFALAGALTLAPALAPIQADTLKLDGARITYGELGSERPNDELLPGDIFFIAFDIKNITVDPAGYVSYNMGMEVTDPKGEKILEQKPTDNKDFLPLGGDTLPARAYITLGADQPPGEYNCKITVTDMANMSTQSIERKFTVKPKRFGIVSLYSTSDANGVVPSPTRGFAGESLWVHFNVIEFQRDATSMQPNVEFQMTVLDEGGKPTVEKPTVYSVNDKVGEMETIIRMRFPIPLNRPGNFKVMLKATDKVAGTEDTVELPVVVVEK